MKPSAPHVYDREPITADAVRSFATDSIDVQRTALATLRQRAGVDRASWVLSLGALLISLAALFLPSPRPISGDWIATDASSFVSGGFIGLLAVPIVLYTGAARDRAGRARAWVAAYEDELARRHRLRDRAGRKWQRSH